MIALMNPDCRDGKHRSCAGDGWDEATDAPAPCSCPCHTVGAVATPFDELLIRAGLMFPALRAAASIAARMQQRWAEDPSRYAAAVALSRESVHTFEEAWHSLRIPPVPTITITYVLEPAPDPDKRTAALAAKAAQGKGPPSSASWRGRERTTKFRSQS